MAEGTCKFLVVRCLDYRLNEVWTRFLRTFGLKPESQDYEEERIIAGAMDLPQLTRHLKLAFVEHGVRQVILTVHEDCATSAVENDLFRALAEIHAAVYVGLEVQAFYFYRSGKDWSWRDVTN